ncbi:MAG: hypothetical protein PHG23_03745 [Candidatus Pacebacteria bacterium]|nr:hypothetical protein [Candidatus Paceibacterota bacterium]
MGADRKLRKKIRELIKESTDEKIHGRAFRDEAWLSKLLFSDLMDVVLFYISLQPDLNEIGKIKTNDFYRLLEDVWKKWAADKKNKAFADNFYSAWFAGPGPMDGTAGPAEMYMLYYTGLLHYDYLLVFFRYPEGLPDGWIPYREHIEIMAFPKWRRENNFKELGKIFNLAEMMCEALRAKQNTER